ncbi:MAG: alanine racemase [Sphingobium sp.]
MTAEFLAPLRLSLNSAALVSNWLWLRTQSGNAACGAAIKADGYGLGVEGVMRRLMQAGCRDFFVATWAEAREVLPLLADGISLSVLHGVRAEDMTLALGSRAQPVLNSAEQVARWKAAGGGPCDVMIDTGMNRLGIGMDDIVPGMLGGLEIITLMSHLACADEDHDMNVLQLGAFRHARQAYPARRYSLANSAGIFLGADYAFDLTRPGIALYGGIARSECEGNIRAVVTPQAQILQRRNIPGGASVGYGAQYVAADPRETATINIGYADGYLRNLGSYGAAVADGVRLPIIGRVSMDLVGLDVSDRPDLREGDWVDMEYNLPLLSAASGLSQYELLTGLGSRFDRCWV